MKTTVNAHFRRPSVATLLKCKFQHPDSFFFRVTRWATHFVYSKIVVFLALASGENVHWPSSSFHYHNHLDITKRTVLLTVDHLNITTFCFYVFQIVIVVVITFIGQRTLGKHLDESTPDKV